MNQLHKMNDVRFHTVYDYRSSNVQKLLENAELVDWSSFATSDADVNQQWQRLLSCLKALINSAIPQETVTLTSKDHSWMTPLTKLLLNKKWSAFRSKDWNIYSHLKTKVKEEIRKDKCLWTNKLKDSSPKGFWTIASYLSGKKQKNHLQNLTKASSPSTLAEVIAATITSNDENSFSYHDADDCTWNLTFSESEVHKCLANS